MNISCYPGIEVCACTIIIIMSVESWTRKFYSSHLYLWFPQIRLLWDTVTHHSPLGFTRNTSSTECCYGRHEEFLKDSWVEQAIMLPRDNVLSEKIKAKHRQKLGSSRLQSNGRLFSTIIATWQHISVNKTATCKSRQNNVIRTSRFLFLRMLRYITILNSSITVLLNVHYMGNR